MFTAQNKNKNLCVTGFTTTTYSGDDEIKTIKNYNPEIIYIIGISGSELWLEKINSEFKNVVCEEFDEIMKPNLKSCFYQDLENHAINTLYDYFIDKKMFMEAFICMRFLNLDLTKQKKYVLVNIGEMVKKIMTFSTKHKSKKILIFCPWKIITPSIIGNLISNLNYEDYKMKFSDPLSLKLDYDDINTHKVSLGKLLNEKSNVDIDIYNHVLSILIKIWILENKKKEKIQEFSDTIIFCLNITIQYLYKNKRIHDIYELWEFYKFDIDMDNMDSAYILLYYSKYLSYVGLINEASKYLIKAVEINKELNDSIKEIIENNKKSI